MARLNAVMVALGVARGRRDQTVLLLRDAQRVWAGARAQLEQLGNYADETRDKWALASRQTTTPEILLHYNQFMQRLVQAFDLQQQSVARHEQVLAAHNRALQQIDIRIAGLDRLLETKRLAASRALAAQEQARQDEFAAQQYRRHRATLESMGAA